VSLDSFNTPQWKALHPEQYPPAGAITKDSTHALMSQRVFDNLDEYSSSLPSGTIPGKHWKLLSNTGVWFLRWYEQDPTDEGFLLIPSRLILIS